MNQQLPANTSAPASQQRFPRTAEEQELWELSAGLSDASNWSKPVDWSKIPPEIAHWIRTGETSAPTSQKRIPRTAEEQEQWELSRPISMFTDGNGTAPIDKSKLTPRQLEWLREIEALKINLVTSEED